MKIKEKYNRKTKQALSLLLKINVPFVEACRVLGLHLIREHHHSENKGVSHG